MDDHDNDGDDVDDKNDHVEDDDNDGDNVVNEIHDNEDDDNDEEGDEEVGSEDNTNNETGTRKLKRIVCFID